MIITNAALRTGRGGSGGGGGSGDDLDFFLKWMLGMMLAILLGLGGFLQYLWWSNSVIHRDSFKIELVVDSANARRTSGKSKRNYWSITLKDNASKEYYDSLSRRGSDPVFQTNEKFTTYIVWHTLRNGKKRYYFPDLGKDIPRIKKDGD